MGKGRCKNRVFFPLSNENIQVMPICFWQTRKYLLLILKDRYIIISYVFLLFSLIVRTKFSLLTDVWYMYICVIGAVRHTPFTLTLWSIHPELKYTFLALKSLCEDRKARCFDSHRVDPGKLHYLTHFKINAQKKIGFIMWRQKSTILWTILV